VNTTTCLELYLGLLPDDIRYCEQALYARRMSFNPSIRAAELITAIAWLKAAQKQLDLAQKAAASLARKEGAS
jgi:hypothetical protein